MSCVRGYIHIYNFQLFALSCCEAASNKPASSSGNASCHQRFKKHFYLRGVQEVVGEAGRQLAQILLDRVETLPLLPLVHPHTLLHYDFDEEINMLLEFLYHANLFSASETER